MAGSKQKTAEKIMRNVSPSRITITLMTILRDYYRGRVLYLCTDKDLRSLQKRRIPEKTLFAFAIVGGALGGTLGMYGFRHKTLHKTFAIGFPLLAIVQIAAVVFLVIKFA